MSTALDLSLDDIIKNNKRPVAGGIRGGRGRGSGGPGPARRSRIRSSVRPSPYSAGQLPDLAVQFGMYSDQMTVGYSDPIVRASAIASGTKLYISNLDYGVSNDDIKELFAEVGDLKHFSIHYDRSGRSKGTAEVVFSRRSDALAAVRRYNNVQLDGKPMKIEIVGTNTSSPAVPMVPNGGLRVPNGGFGNSNGFPRSGPARGGYTGWPRGGRGKGRGGGRGRGRGGRGEQVSATHLDADLEKYHQEAMQTN